MINSKLTAARAIFPLLTLGLIVPACLAAPESGDEADRTDDEFFASDPEENVAEAIEALTTVTTTRGTVPNSACSTYSSVSLSLGSNVTADKLAPWKSLAAGGTFSLGIGANGVQVRYWIDNVNIQTDAVATNAASGTWTWTNDNITCEPHTFTVCAIPYVNGNACGDLNAPTTSGYRQCRQVSFRGCSNAVGVIPDFNTNCPTGTDTLIRHMDDEDQTWSGNDNAHSGWIGKTVSDNNTRMTYCRVDGTTFKPLTTCSSDTAGDYAVLKLGSVCPNGSVEFSKYIDNENYRNANSHSVSSGDYHPNVYTENTKLFFCFFGSASSLSATMGKFPSVGGISYGVFGRSVLVNAGAASTSGWFRSDDENQGGNTYSAPSSILNRTALLISHSTQTTTFNTAKVKTATNQGTGVGCAACGDGTCQYPETVSSCASDCAYCGDGICSNGETGSSCPSDCGYCGDGTCDSDESNTTCPADCGSSGCCTQQQAAAAKMNSLLPPCPCIAE